ncbi:response regulator [Hymenobacter sp. BT559]|jgi:CheY-like chemotaxis protein|uniref:response regulator n=1 Tax=Hymenobacter sp. BT559 TaxID=2795729 RepID=UPI0018EB3D2A|nr:response regulator [Hymenobacter sp. BT559]MBJ6144200.1 response regulator [Hymenobacter sp. BT559]
MQKLSSVLLVDDDPTTNFLHEQLLLSLGVTDHCLVAENGADALALLAENLPPNDQCPALVLLDVHMPVMDGIEFLEAYVQPPSPPPVVIVLTTSVHARDQARMAKLPVADWVSKPLTRAKVDAILQQHFQRQLPPGDEE